MSERAPGPAGRPRILFTTSNGTGLGHLTRSMAIARRLADRAEPLFLTLSAAAPVVERMGFPVEFVPAYGTPVSGNDYRWSRRLRARLRAAIAEAEPAVIVFDGTHPYEALLGALPAGATAVWCRRPLWKRGSSRVPLGRAGAFDAVLEPGELAAAEDAGPTVALRDARPPRRADRAPRSCRAAAAGRGGGRARARPWRTDGAGQPGPGGGGPRRDPAGAVGAGGARRGPGRAPCPRPWPRPTRSPRGSSSCAPPTR